MKYIIAGLFGLLLVAGWSSMAFAQTSERSFSFSSASPTATTSTTTKALTAVNENSPSTTANLILEKGAQAASQDKTLPEELPEKVAIITAFDARKVEEPGLFSFMAYWVQEAVALGIPANTIFLILLTPILALLVTFVRVVIGLPTLDMLVPIALSFAFVAVGVAVGVIVLGAILLSSYLSKMSLKKMLIMFYPKRSISILFLSLFVFGALTIALASGFERIVSVSIFPILVLMLLGDSIVTVQLTKSVNETLTITGATLLLGLIGYLLAVSESMSNYLLLYPELVLLTIPLNILIGRYFGLRLVEFFRFKSMSD